MLAANFFLTRLIFSSVFIVAYNGPDQCGAECKVPALALLTLISLYLMTALALLLHFSFTYRKQAWQPAIPADTPNGVEDPMYRLISRIRVRICRSGRKFTIMDRRYATIAPCLGSRTHTLTLAVAVSLTASFPVTVAAEVSGCTTTMRLWSPTAPSAY
jgi:hypothetical protein